MDYNPPPKARVTFRRFFRRLMFSIYSCSLFNFPVLFSREGLGMVFLAIIFIFVSIT